MPKPRYRPQPAINTLRLTLERGDGECLDLGAVPEPSNFAEVAAFCVRLQEALGKVGSYQIHTQDWSPRRLEFHVTDLPKKPAEGEY